MLRLHESLNIIDYKNNRCLLVIYFLVKNSLICLLALWSEKNLDAKLIIDTKARICIKNLRASLTTFHRVKYYLRMNLDAFSSSEK